MEYGSQPTPCEPPILALIQAKGGYENLNEILLSPLSPAGVGLFSPTGRPQCQGVAESNRISVPEKRQNTRFEFYLSRISLPYAIFNVEFTPDYKRYNHIKVDLYSAELDTEDNRRSFIIWEWDDPDNYHFFLDSFNRLRMDSESCIRISKGKESILSSLI